MLTAAALIAVFSGPAAAKVTGVCSNCHTMHNSQNGSGMATGELPPGDGPPHQNLLINSCLGCHTGTNDGNNTTPYVMATNAPTFTFNGSGNTLAGGNFWWVAQGTTAEYDSKGHNIFSDNADSLTEAPGRDAVGCGGSTSCHLNLHTTDTSYSSRQGCTKCHMMGESINSSGYPNGYHHANDGTGTKYVDSAAKGWYRFLSGHMCDLSIGGVKGIEHEKWNYGATVGGTNHNEYSGIVWPGGYGFGCFGSVMTAYCTGCHGLFHSDQHQGEDEASSDPWIRHPSDAVIPSTAGSEYAAMSTLYNPNVPVARPSGHSVWTSGPSATVAAGTDMVMCLSCHVAHGSPYDDMLRWDYDSDMIAGGGSNTTGCFVCHTKKDTGG